MTQKWLGQTDPKGTQKRLKSDFWAIFESLLSHLGSLWRGALGVTFESILGHFNPFWVSVELGARWLPNIRTSDSSERLTKFTTSLWDGDFPSRMTPSSENGFFKRATQQGPYFGDFSRSRLKSSSEMMKCLNCLRAKGLLPFVAELLQSVILVLRITIGAENITYINKIRGNLFDVTRCNTLHHLYCQEFIWCDVCWCCSFGVVMVPLGLTHIHDAGIGDV